MAIRMLSCALAALLPAAAVPAAVPVPPMQDAPWKAPASWMDGDGSVAAVVIAAFAHGLADPRGCAYRHVQVREAGELYEAHGWVLPGDDDGNRWAIGWNGLVYPLERVGEPADLDADIGHLLEHGSLLVEDPPNLREDLGIDDLFARFRSTPRISSHWAAVLLTARLGRLELARNWECLGGPLDEDPFGQVAPAAGEFQWDWNEIEWLEEWALVNRADAYAAFMEGQWSACAQRGPVFERAWRRAGELIAENNEGLKAPDLDAVADPFPDPDWIQTLPQLPKGFEELVTDAARRAKQERPAPADNLLETWLDSWDELQDFDPEQPPALFARVVARGRAAIPALLERVRDDRRYTRIVHRDDQRYWTRPVPVGDVAILAIERILDIRALPEDLEVGELGPDTEWYRGVATSLAAFCERHPELTGPRLWHRVLGDSKLDPGSRFVAALAIIEPEKYPATVPGWWFERWSLAFAMEGYNTDLARAYREEGDSMRGESLRGVVDPPVAEMILRAYRDARVWAEELEKQEEFQLPQHPNAGMVHAWSPSPRGGVQDFLDALLEWDPKTGLAPLRDHFGWLEESILPDLKKERWKDQPYTLTHRIWYLNRTLQLRFEREDPEAPADFIRIANTYLEHDEPIWVPLDLLAQLDDKEAAERIGHALFRKDGAPFSFDTKWKGYAWRGHLLRSNGDLLGLTPYRDAVLAGLRNQNEQVQLVTAQDGFTLKWGDRNDREVKTRPNLDFQRPPAGTERAIRSCDLVAWGLSEMRDTGPLATHPAAFRMEADRKARDIAIAKWIAALERL